MNDDVLYFQEKRSKTQFPFFLILLKNVLITLVEIHKLTLQNHMSASLTLYGTGIYIYALHMHCLQ